ncbi:hypothetical protein [Lentzea guizhouensis]|uniref:hypothetical protein n=1 Tax=Lentzea guizhouensis TaxID=1586287 RepID=UPI001C54E628|nr:hypothetical protein [Lentzea guizhouensis]
MAERGANGSAYGAAHSSGQGVGIARNLVDDGLDHLVGGRLQRRPQRGDRRLIEGQLGGPPHCMSHDLFPANNLVEQIHVVRTGLYALWRIKLES